MALFMTSNIDAAKPLILCNAHLLCYTVVVIHVVGFNCWCAFPFESRKCEFGSYGVLGITHDTRGVVCGGAESHNDDISCCYHL